MLILLGFEIILNYENYFLAPVAAAKHDQDVFSFQAFKKRLIAKVYKSKSHKV